MASHGRSAPDQLLPPRQVAAVLGVNEETLQRWRAAGRGPASESGPAGPAYRARELEAWQDRLGAPPPAPAREAVLHRMPSGVAVLSVLAEGFGNAQHHFEVRRGRQPMGRFDTLVEVYRFLRAVAAD